MSKCSLAPRLVLPIFSCVCALAITGFPAQAQNESNYGAAAGGWHQIESGMPPVMIHPTREASEQAREAKPHKSNSSKDLYYHGGVGGIGVETAPKVYLVLWGSQWNGNDPSGEESLLVSFFKGVGGSSWLNSVTQYCQGVPTGTYYCNGAGTKAGNPSGIFVAAWYDNASAAPSHPTQSQLAAEASRAAQFFGNTTSSKNASVQYVIATAQQIGRAHV